MSVRPAGWANPGLPAHRGQRAPGLL
jgi:hypothetical protein